MVELDRFREIVADAMDELPDGMFRDLSGGVIVSEQEKRQPESVEDGAGPLYILGTYSTGRLGRQVTIYYGSFLRVMGRADEEAVRQKVREVLRHEMRHHFELMGGMRGKDSLEHRDNVELEQYRERAARRKKD